MTTLLLTLAAAYVLHRAFQFQERRERERDTIRPHTSFRPSTRHF